MLSLDLGAIVRPPGPAVLMSPSGYGETSDVLRRNASFVLVIPPCGDRSPFHSIKPTIRAGAVRRAMPRHRVSAAMHPMAGFMPPKAGFLCPNAALRFA